MVDHEICNISCILFGGWFCIVNCGHEYISANDLPVGFILEIDYLLGWDIWGKLISEYYKACDQLVYEREVMYY
jgi:hypothetical protein